MRKMIMLVISLQFVWCSAAHALFNSGSTGALGPLTFSAMSTARHITLPVDGKLNYTTVNIPAGVTVTFIKNAANTPVYMLAQGNVTINGTISVNGTGGSAVPGQGGPGGFNGGYGSTVTDPGGRGLGPGGGYPSSPSCNYGGGGGGFGTAGTSSCGAGGGTYGTAQLFPLIGGSGGGGCGAQNGSVFNGGGGGGAILIASSENITLNGSITANGAGGGSAGSPGGDSAGGGGSGGGIRLIANNIYGNGSITATGGNGTSRGFGGAGRIRLEAYTNNNTISANPDYTVSNTPGSVIPAAAPSLAITSIVAGNTYPVPAIPTGSYSQPDITLPSGTTSAVVNITAYNIPTSTQLIVRVIPKYGSDSSVNAATLSGTQVQSTTSATVTTLSPSYSNVITAQATFTVVGIYWDGEEIDKVRVAATLGKKSETTYITRSGKEIKGELIAALIK